MNFQVVLEWVKANVFIVVFIVLMIAAPIVMFLVSSGMNADVQKKVKERASKADELKRLETPYEIFGVSRTGVPNEELIRKYEEVAKSMTGDAASVRQAALERNRGTHRPLRPDILPEMPANQRDVLPEKFHITLMEAYRTLLAEVGAGSPPPLESLRQAIDLSRSTFITQDLKKDPHDKLSDDELARLTEHLSNARMALYSKAADEIGMYLAFETLGAPAWEKNRQPSPGELYLWQWQFWIIDDVLKALHSANGDLKVPHAPVKQVLSISVDDLPRAPDVGAAGPAGSSSTPGKLGGSGAGGFGGGQDAPPPPPAEGEAAAPAGAAPADPKAPVALNYAASITGRVTNPLYDVVHVTLDMVVETAKLPQVIDALAKHNFMTVTELELTTTDPFASAQNGFLFGAGATSTVHLKLETIWFREWTKPFMPAAIKAALGIPSDSSAGPAIEPPPPPST